MKIQKYISLGKPIRVGEFEENEAPIGWKRLDRVKENILSDEKIKDQFTRAELMTILYNDFK